MPNLYPQDSDDIFSWDFREWEEVEDIPWMYSIPLEMEEEQSTEYQIIAETKMMN